MDAGAFYKLDSTRNSSGDEIANVTIRLFDHPGPSCLTLSEGAISLDDLHDFWWMSCQMARLQSYNVVQK